MFYSQPLQTVGMQVNSCPFIIQRNYEKKCAFGGSVLFSEAIYIVSKNDSFTLFEELILSTLVIFRSIFSPSYCIFIVTYTNCSPRFTALSVLFVSENSYNFIYQRGSIFPSFKFLKLHIEKHKMALVWRKEKWSCRKKNMNIILNKCAEGIYWLFLSTNLVNEIRNLVEKKPSNALPFLTCLSSWTFWS